MAKAGKKSVGVRATGMALLPFMIGKDSSKPKKAGVRMEKLANINFPVSRIRTRMRKLMANKTVTKHGAIFLAAQMEYILAEVVDLAGNMMEADKKKTLQGKHLFKAVHDDAELNNFFGQGLIHEGGVSITVTDRHFKTQKRIKEDEKRASRKAAKEQLATMGA